MAKSLSSFCQLLRTIVDRIFVLQARDPHDLPADGAPRGQLGGRDPRAGRGAVTTGGGERGGAERVRGQRGRGLQPRGHLAHPPVQVHSTVHNNFTITVKDLLLLKQFSCMFY